MSVIGEVSAAQEARSERRSPTESDAARWRDATVRTAPRSYSGRSALRGYLMTTRNWKLSQVISLTFVGAILAFVLISALGAGESTLMSDTVIAQTASY